MREWALDRWPENTQVDLPKELLRLKAEIKLQREIEEQAQKERDQKEFIEDCRHPLPDLSKSSPRSAHDEQYTYNFANIDNLSSPLGIPWE